MKIIIRNNKTDLSKIVDCDSYNYYEFKKLVNAYLKAGYDYKIVR